LRLLGSEKLMPDAELTTDQDTAAAESTIQPLRSLWLLSAAHAVNHAQAALLPLVYLVIIPEFNVSVAAIAILAAAGIVAYGLIQLSYAALTRFFSRRTILSVGGI